MNTDDMEIMVLAWVVQYKNGDKGIMSVRPSEPTATPDVATRHTSLDRAWKQFRKDLDQFVGAKQLEKRRTSGRTKKTIPA